MLNFMPGSGEGRLAAAELTMKGLKGKALVEAMDQEFSPESLANEGSKGEIAKDDCY